MRSRSIQVYFAFPFPNFPFPNFFLIDEIDLGQVYMSLGIGCSRKGSVFSLYRISFRSFQVYLGVNTDLRKIFGLVFINQSTHFSEARADQCKG